MLGPLQWRSLGKERPLMGPPHGSQQHLSPRLSSCCWVSRARAALLAPGVTVPVTPRRGHYLKAYCTEPCGNSTCIPCPQGTFLARENHSQTRCIRCQTCDEEASQVALENCSAVADTQCGCELGWFMDCLAKPCRENSPFRCLQCKNYEVLSSPTQLPFSGRDNRCVHCLPGFYEHGGSCMSCPTSVFGNCPEPCAAICGWRQMFWVQVLVAGLIVPLSLGAALIYTYRCCQPHKPMIPDTAGTEPLTPPQRPHFSDAPWQQWEGLHCPVGSQQLDSWLPPDPGDAHTVLGPAACSWPPIGISTSAPCRLASRHAPAWPTALRRDGRGSCTALEGVRAHAGAARGGDRGRGGGDLPLP
ncbi:tumor necrosis factor receptor superfamily member 25 isoform X5 [Castor canadensis]|uniref:Tumor necrosis factor receptor superfamily member 25 isoform X5 n=1 Tax=Castor canadensis TaxID=51338 RepID=A0AC58N7R2_CASCN